MGVRNELKCFKAYDVRGRLGQEINEDVAYRIGRATVRALGVKSVALGFDARETSPSLAKALAVGITNEGANVIELGLSGTEEMYSAVVEFNLGAGIEVTASHNPIESLQPLSFFDGVNELASLKQRFVSTCIQPRHPAS